MGVVRAVEHAFANFETPSSNGSSNAGNVVRNVLPVGKGVAGGKVMSWGGDLWNRSPGTRSGGLNLPTAIGLTALTASHSGTRSRMGHDLSAILSNPVGMQHSRPRHTPY